jgi:hypothetical protein
MYAVILGVNELQNENNKVPSSAEEGCASRHPSSAEEGTSFAPFNYFTHFVIARLVEEYAI